MTSDELAFIAALDAEPENHWLRCVFADWLDDRDDPRAAGYRAMGRLGLEVEFNGISAYIHDESRKMDAAYHISPAPEASFFPRLWYDEAVARRIEQGLRGSDDISCCCDVGTSRDAGRNLAAIAWTKLSPSQQARILADAGVMV